MKCRHRTRVVSTKDIRVIRIVDGEGEVDPCVYSTLYYRGRSYMCNIHYTYSVIILNNFQILLRFHRTTDTLGNYFLMVCWAFFFFFTKIVTFPHSLLFADIVAKTRVNTKFNIIRCTTITRTAHIAVTHVYDPNT